MSGEGQYQITTLFLFLFGVILRVIKNMEPHETFELPFSYGKSFITLLPRDPDWIYIFWEIIPEDVGNCKEKVNDFGSDSNLVLRVYNASPSARQKRQRDNYFDIEVSEWLGRRYVLWGTPNTIHSVAIGYRSKQGVFAAITRSEFVKSPRSENEHSSDPVFVKVSYDSSKPEIVEI